MRAARSWRHLHVLAASMVVLALSLVVVSDASSASLHERRAQSSTKSARERIPSNTELADVAFLSPTRGYGLFVVEGSVTCSDRVGATTNGGARFSLPVFVTSSCAARTLRPRDHWRSTITATAFSMGHDSSSPTTAVRRGLRVLNRTQSSVSKSSVAPSGCSKRAVRCHHRRRTTPRIVFFSSTPVTEAGRGPPSRRPGPPT